MINSKERFSKEDFFELCLKIYLGQVKRENFLKNGNPLKIYSELKKQIIKDVQSIEDEKELTDILDRFHYVIMNNREKIISKNMTLKDFSKEFGSYIMRFDIIKESKLYSRDFDMSDMFNPSCISDKVDKITGEKIKEGILLPSREEHKEHKFFNREGEEFLIKKIGQIQYATNCNTIGNQLSQYQIRRPKGDGQYNTYEVFSNIKISDMGRTDYRDAVLDILLSDENITMSNAGGYIGEITTTPKKLKGREEGTPINEIKGEKGYKVNDKYSLIFNELDLTAAMIFGGNGKEVRGDNKSNKDKEDKEL